MHVVNIHEAKTHLSRLIARAMQGDSFIIAKAGKPLVKVTAIDAPPASRMRRIGFLKDADWIVPDNFDEFGREEIDEMFGLKP